MESYIIRIYRRDENAPENIVGLVEEVGTDAERVFRNLEELNFILTGGKPEKEGCIAVEKRKAERLKLRLPAMITGMSTSGKTFTEETVLDDLSPCGAHLYVGNPVKRGDLIKMLIDPGQSNLNVDARVVRQESRNGKTGLGVSFCCSLCS